MEHDIIRTLRKHKKGTKHKFKKKKKQKKKQKKKKQTIRRQPIQGREGVDFKKFHIDPNKPSSCRSRTDKVKRSKCKSHGMRMGLPKMRIPKMIQSRMRIPRMRVGRCKSRGMNKGQFIINQMINPMHKHKHMKIETPKKKKCKKSFIHFINL